MFPGAFVLLVALLTYRPLFASQQQDDPRPRRTDPRPGLEASGAALDLRRDAANGTGAPQIGLNPNWARKSYAHWDETKEKYPEAAAQYESCAEKFKEAIETIRPIAPLTKRPVWDQPGTIDRINEAIRQAKDLITAGDKCMNAANDQSRSGQSGGTVLKGRVEKNEGEPPPPPPGDDADNDDAAGGDDVGSGVPLPMPGKGGSTRPPPPKGGYDPCQNPVPPPGCRTSPAPSQPPPSPITDPNGDPDGLVKLFHLLDATLDRIAPHYDMTRPHEGVRIIKDIVIDMGLGYATKGIGKVLGDWVQARRALPHAPPPGSTRPVMAKNRGWQNSRGTAEPSGGESGSGFGADLPHTGGSVPVPSVLQTTPRPVYLQETETSCGAAAVRMVNTTVTGRDLGELTFRNLTRNGESAARASSGTVNIRQLGDALRRTGLKADAFENVTVDHLAQATANGSPAIVRIGDFNAGHFVVVDGVAADASGAWYLFIRDPANYGLSNPMTRQFLDGLGFSNSPVVAEADFLNVFKQFDQFGNAISGRGLAVLTGH